MVTYSSCADFAANSLLAFFMVSAMTHPPTHHRPRARASLPPALLARIWTRSAAAGPHNSTMHAGAGPGMLLPAWRAAVPAQP